MSRVWQVAPEERTDDARPGAALVAAGAVPLGAAVLIAAAMLPWGVRLVVGTVLVGLGLGLRLRTPEAARAIGTALVVGGVVLIVAAIGVALDGGRLEGGNGFDSDDPRFGLGIAGAGPYGVFGAFDANLDGWAGTAFGALLAAAGAGLVRVLRTPAVGVSVAGLGIAAGLLSLTGGGALGLGDDARATALVAVAAVGITVVALRPAGDGGGRAAGAAAGLVLALVVGEATGLVQLALSSGISSEVLAPRSAGLVALVLVAAAAVAAVLVVVAIRRRDVLLGALPAGVLLLTHAAEPTVVKIGVLLVPVLLVAVSGAALAGVPAARRWVPGAFAPAATAAAALVLVVALTGVIDPSGAFLPSSANGFDGVGVRGGRLAVALVATITIGSTAVVALRLDGPGGVATALTAIVGLHLVHPLALFRAAAPDSFVAGDVAAVVLALAELAVGLVVARRHATPVVLAAVGLLAAVELQSIAFGIAFSGGDADGALLTALTLGPATLVFVVAALVALLGPEHLVLRAQAAAAGAALGAAIFGGFAISAIAFVSGDGSTLDGVDAALAIGLVVLFGLGTALLAASTARRASAPIAGAAIAATAMLAIVVAAVGSALAGGDGETIRTLSAPVLQLALGFDDVGSPLQWVSPVWPVVLGVLGAAVVAAGAARTGPRGRPGER